MVIQLQQELFTLKAQVAARVQIASAVQARSLTAAQVRKCAPSLTNTNDMGRPQEVSGKDRGVHNMECVLQHMHEMLRTRTSQEANDIVAN